MFIRDRGGVLFLFLPSLTFSLLLRLGWCFGRLLLLRLGWCFGLFHLFGCRSECFSLVAQSRIPIGTLFFFKAIGAKVLVFKFVRLLVARGAANIA